MEKSLELLFGKFQKTKKFLTSESGVAREWRDRKLIIIIIIINFPDETRDEEKRRKFFFV